MPIVRSLPLPRESEDEFALQDLGSGNDAENDDDLTSFEDIADPEPIALETAEMADARLDYEVAKGIWHDLVTEGGSDIEILEARVELEQRRQEYGDLVEADLEARREKIQGEFDDLVEQRNMMIARYDGMNDFTWELEGGYTRRVGPWWMGPFRPRRQEGGDYVSKPNPAKAELGREIAELNGRIKAARTRAGLVQRESGEIADLLKESRDTESAAGDAIERRRKKARSILDEFGKRERAGITLPRDRDVGSRSSREQSRSATSRRDHRDTRRESSRNVRTGGSSRGRHRPSDRGFGLHDGRVPTGGTQPLRSDYDDDYDDAFDPNFEPPDDDSYDGGWHDSYAPGDPIGEEGYEDGGESDLDHWIDGPGSDDDDEHDTDNGWGSGGDDEWDDDDDDDWSSDDGPGDDDDDQDFGGSPSSDPAPVSREEAEKLDNEVDKGRGDDAPLFDDPPEDPDDGPADDDDNDREDESDRGSNDDPWDDDREDDDSDDEEDRKGKVKLKPKTPYDRERKHAEPDRPDRPRPKSRGESKPPIGKPNRGGGGASGDKPPSRRGKPPANGKPNRGRGKAGGGAVVDLKDKLDAIDNRVEGLKTANQIQTEIELLNQRKEGLDELLEEGRKELERRGGSDPTLEKFMRELERERKSIPLEIEKHRVPQIRDSLRDSIRGRED